MSDPYSALGQGLIAAGQSIGQGLAGRSQNALDLMRLRKQLELEQERLGLDRARIELAQKQDEWNRSQWAPPETIAYPSGLQGKVDIAPPLGGLQPPPEALRQGGYVTTGGGLQAQQALTQMREPEVARGFQAEQARIERGFQGQQNALDRALQRELAGGGEAGEQIDWSTPYDENGNIKGEIISQILYSDAIGGTPAMMLNRPDADALARQVGEALALRYPGEPGIREKAYNQLMRNFEAASGGGGQVSLGSLIGAVRETAQSYGQSLREKPVQTATGTVLAGVPAGIAAGAASLAGPALATNPVTAPVAGYLAGKAALESPTGQRIVQGVGDFIRNDIPQAVQSARQAGGGAVESLRERAGSAIESVGDTLQNARAEVLVRRIESLDEDIAHMRERGDPEYMIRSIEERRDRLVERLYGLRGGE